MIRIPKTGNNGQPMTYYHITSASIPHEISRHDFFELIRNTPDGDKHVVPDIDAALVYFVQDCAQCTEMSCFFCKEADRQRKQYARRYECVYKGTDKCDGWTNDPDRVHDCSTCQRRDTCRTLSINATMADSDGNEFEFGETLPDTKSESADDAVLRDCERKLLRGALNSISEEDREYILTRYSDGMDFGKLAEIYSIDRRYASKRAGRIEDHIRKSIEKM